MVVYRGELHGLSATPANGTQKGLYILGGKKVLVK